MNPNKEKINRIKELLITKEFSALYKAIQKLIDTTEKKPQPQIIAQIPQSAFDVAKSVEVRNFPQQPEVQKVKLAENESIKVHVLNQKDVQKVEVINHKEKGSEKSSSWVPSLVSYAVKSLAEGIAKRLDRGITVKLDDEERLKPLPVIVVDVKGRPANLAPNITVGGFMPGSQSSGGVIPTGSTIGNGRKTITTAGVAEKLTSSATPCRKVIITALSTNGGVVSIGGSTTSAQSGSENGLILIGSFAREIIDIDDVSKIYIDASTSGEGVSFTYLR